MIQRVTLKMIAAKAGVHVSTVSLALNNHPSLPVATRERIQNLAAKMGYRPDPMLSALVSYRSGKRKKTDQGVIAWVDAWGGAISARQHFPALWSAAAARAESLGWKLEEFRLKQLGLSSDGFSRMLWTRNIVMALIAPLQGKGGALNFDWSCLSAVATSHTLESPHLHRVVPHQTHNMQLLMKELFALGYKRPGLTIDDTANERTRHHWWAAFLDAQQTLPESERLPVLVSDGTDDRVLLAWVKRQRPDVLIASKAAEAMGVLRGAGIKVPESIGVAAVAFPVESWQADKDLSEGGPKRRLDLSGVDERFDAIGAAAIESIVAMMHRHEMGVPEVAKHIMIEGRWHPGNTVRAR
jgi:LacI family transcriptional regulator